jgi:hypothetical protein
VLSFWLCKDVEGTEYLVADFTLGCGNSDPKWHSWVPYGVVATIVYPLGVPLLFAALLIYHRDSLKTPRTTAFFGFLYEGYNHDVWWFELVYVVVTLTSSLSTLRFLCFV